MFKPLSVGHTKNGRRAAMCPKCGVSMRKDNLIRHMEKCREAASEAPIRLGKRRSRCPKCKEEMHSNKVRGHIEACRVKSVPKPDSIDVRGHDAAIKTGVYVRINSFGEYGLQTDIDDAMKKYGHLNDPSLLNKPVLKFKYIENGYALVKENEGRIVAKFIQKAWHILSKDSWEIDDALRVTWN